MKKNLILKSSQIYQSYIILYFEQFNNGIILILSILNGDILIEWIDKQTIQKKTYFLNLQNTFFLLLYDKKCCTLMNYQLIERFFIFFFIFVIF